MAQKSTLLAVFVYSSLILAGGCGDDSNPTKPEDTGSGIEIPDTDTNAERPEDYILDWDTGTDVYVCLGEFMTAEECLAAAGAFDIKLLETHCVEGKEEKCCLTDVLTNPCPFECMGAAECYDRGGTNLKNVSDYECSLSYYDCCEDAAPLDDDTDQYMGDLFEPLNCPVTDVVTSAEQPNKDASGICTELMDETSDYFCAQADYDRILRDIAAIEAAFPVVLEDRGGQIFNAFPDPTPVSPFAILCVPGVNLNTCTDFPQGSWQDLLDCFGGDHENCLFEDDDNATCGQAHLWFDVGVNVKRMMHDFEEHAKGLVPGSVCELNTYFGLSYPLNGFHVTDFGDGFWRWDVRSTGQPDLGIVHCDIRITVSTSESSTDLTVIEIDNQNDDECQIPAFKNFQ